MASTAASVLREALSLTEPEREALVIALSDSLQAQPVDLGAEWNSEVESRIAEIESGAVRPIPWREVEAHIMRSLGHD